MRASTSIIAEGTKPREHHHAPIAEWRPLEVIGNSPAIPVGTSLAEVKPQDVLYLDIAIGRIVGYDLLKAVRPSAIPGDLHNCTCRKWTTGHSLQRFELNSEN